MVIYPALYIVIVHKAEIRPLIFSNTVRSVRPFGDDSGHASHDSGEVTGRSL
jgi:hypothetical protein